MTRCCSSFNNCCPEPAPVSIEHNTYNIDGDDVAFDVERFVFNDASPSNPFKTVSPGVVGEPGSYTYYVELSATPIDQGSVSVRMGGTVDQKPYLGSAGESANFQVVGKYVFFFFDLVNDDEVYVKYISTP